VTVQKESNQKGKANILIVDDDAGLCKTTSFILQREGYAVTTAENGEEAIEKVQEEKFDMVLMDIKMPIMDGVEAYKRIKQIRPETKTIMMTGYAVDDLIQDALEEGAHSAIHKPLDMDQILNLLEKIRER